MLKTEVSIMQRLDHPNIIKLHDLYRTDKHYYLVMELATGGELFDRILARGTYSELDAARMVSQITDALQYIHSMNIVHRDLKPENMIFKDKTESSKLLLTDFGLSRGVKTNQFLSTCCGSPHYIAPEVLQNKGHGTQVDMWSLGVIAYVLLCGYTPFWGGEEDSVEKLYQAIVSCDFQFEDEAWADISELAKEFITKLLILDPNHRMTAKGAMNHPWLKTTVDRDILPMYKKNVSAKLREFC